MDRRTEASVRPSPQFVLASFAGKFCLSPGLALAVHRRPTALSLDMRTARLDNFDHAHPDPHMVNKVAIDLVRWRSLHGTDSTSPSDNKPILGSAPLGLSADRGGRACTCIAASSESLRMSTSLLASNGS